MNAAPRQQLAGRQVRSTMHRVALAVAGLGALVVAPWALAAAQVAGVSEQFAQAPFLAPTVLQLDGDPSEWTAGRAADVRIERSDQLVSLDGAAPNAAWTGPADAALEVWLAWNDSGLLLGGLVRDERWDFDARDWFRGDSLELFLSTEDALPEWGADDHQLMLAPAWPERPWGVYPRRPDNPPLASDGGFGGIETASKPVGGGYTFEVRLPWSNFAPYEPSAGDRLPFNMAQCDRDGGERQDSYATWTGQAEIARFADRRGTLELGPRDEPLATGDAVLAVRGLSLRPWLAVLAASFVLAFLTRGVWRRPRAKLVGLLAAAGLISGSLGVGSWMQRKERRAEQRAGQELEQYWSAFEGLLASGGLGRPDAETLRQRAASLLENGSVAPFEVHESVAVPSVGHVLGGEWLTLQRGLSFRPLLPAAEESRAPNPLNGVPLDAGEELVFELPDAQAMGALLVTRVKDRRAPQAGADPFTVLSLTFEGEPDSEPVSFGARHRLDLHHQEAAHLGHPSLDVALRESGGSFGQLHGDAVTFAFESPRKLQRAVLRHVGERSPYRVHVVGLTLLQDSADTPPAGLVLDQGAWRWPAHQARFEAELLTQAAGSPGLPAASPLAELRRPLRLASESLGSVRLTGPQLAARSRRSGVSALGTPALATLVLLAPFLVALFSEWLAARRRIRLKLTLGFAISSAVPLLALTLLLQSALRTERFQLESERAIATIEVAERALERERRALDVEAARLLRIVQLEQRVSRRWPASENELERFWGPLASVAGQASGLELFERVSVDGRRLRLGRGEHWREVPRDTDIASGLQRLWGRLYVCGVAQTPSGAQDALRVVVARPPRLADLTAGEWSGELDEALSISEDAAEAARDRAGAGSTQLRLLGAGKDPQPQVGQLEPQSSRELRRGLFATGGDEQQGELIGVLVARWPERGEAWLGSYTLTELLVVAGITAAFIAVLFAALLTAHLVGPIERLDRAVRDGQASNVRPEVDDEIGHLTRAIATSSAQVGRRVRQLELLQTAQEDWSRALDEDHVRNAVLHFFESDGRARVSFLAWSGESGEAPRLFRVGGPEGGAAIGAEEGLLNSALSSGGVQVLAADALAAASGPLEREHLAALQRTIVLPLQAGGSVRGALLCGYRAADADPDLAFLRTASAQAATALENARLYGQAVRDNVTGFLFEPAFRRRFAEEILRAGEIGGGAGVLVVQLRLDTLPNEEGLAHARLRAAAERMQGATPGLGHFGRLGEPNLLVCVPWTAQAPDAQALCDRLCARVAGQPWPDGKEVGALLVASAAWPADGPSARFVTHVLEQRMLRARGVRSGALTADWRAELPEDFVARAPASLRLLDTVRQLASQEMTLLVLGETGVGKDRLASLVHHWSPRRSGPLVHVHCPSLSESLIEDELFGHLRGAFTGAETRRAGPFELASGGTLVLDEIAGLCAEGQVALLRVLETREVLPVGAQRTLAVDVRVLATTSRDLAALVEAGRFRSDLFFRLNVAQLRVPPLRVRPRDIPPLVEVCLERFRRGGGALGELTPAFLDRLFEHDWPGNVRELENVMMRAMTLADGADLLPEHARLPERPAAAGSGSAVPSAGSSPATRVLNPRQEKLLVGLAAGATLASAEVAQRFGVSSRTALRDLMELCEVGLLQREGERRGTRFRRTERPTAPSYVP